MQQRESEESIDASTVPLNVPETLLSPSLHHSPDSPAHAYELKFLLPEDGARELQSWAAKHLNVDAYADAERDNSYQTTTLYLDTATLDVLNRTRDFRGNKYRLRRYGQEANIYLEQKRRRGDRVRKRRTCVRDENVAMSEPTDSQLDSSDAWFREKVLRHALQPQCCLTYDRAAFAKLGVSGPMRLTFDRRIRGVTTTDWAVRPVLSGTEILSGEVICEFKFRESLPVLFQQIIAEMQLQPASVSKYRRLMQALRIPHEATLEGETQNA